jgi:phosphate:Na+ symporter
VVQSGSAVTGILIVMASQGLIALEPAIAITLGANVGSCVTALIASIGKPRVALRAAMVHVLFNVLGAALWFEFIPQLADLARMISPVQTGLEGAVRLIAETPRQVANAQTLFNLASAALFLGFTSQFARLVEWLFPDRPDPADAAMRPKYLDKSLLSTPAIALEAARMESARLGERVIEMVSAIMPAAMSGSRSRLEEVAAMDKAVDALHFATVEYLGKISLTQLSPPQVDELMRLVQLANDLESLGDRLAIGMVTSAQKRIDEDVRVSADTARMLTDFHAFVASALTDALKAFSTRDVGLAKAVRHRKRDLARLSRNITEHGLGRLTADAPNRLHTYAREMEIIEILDSVFNLARRIARTQLKSSHQLPAEDPLTSNH